MNDDRRLTTSDLADAVDRAEAAGNPDVAESHVALFGRADTEGYRTRWSAIQTGFVDEPRRAVEEADALVAEVIRRLAEGFADERRGLEAEWDRNERVSTEDLRRAMQRYRSFFERLLTV